MSKNRKRNSVLLLLTFMFLISAIVYAIYYNSYSKYYEHTDNAYVGQDIVYITPQTNGIVKKVYADSMQSVKKGEIVAKLDSLDKEFKLKKAKLALAKIVRDIKELQSKKEQAKESINLAKIQLEQALNDLNRNRSLVATNNITKQKYQNLIFASQVAKSKLKIAKEHYREITNILKDDNISNNPAVKSAIVNLEQALLNLKRCNIIAPISGIIAKKNISIGSFVTKQSSIFAIIPKQDYWVDANFKETQLKNIYIDQNVTLTSDFYGKDIVYHGKVKAIAPGTGAIFSLIPPQNATGNWIKIVQRVPVRITLNQKELKKYPLKIGNSMSVKIDTHNRNGNRVNSKILPADTIKNDSLNKDIIKEADKIAQNIIRQNS